MALAARTSILFVCRDNAGLSLMAEAITLHAHSALRAFSAGVSSHAPVDIAALECLHAARIPADGLKAKPLELFGFSGAPRIDLVVAMGDAAREAVAGLAIRPLVRFKTWAFEDVSSLAEIHQRRLAYRRLLPRLQAAIRDLVEMEAPETAAA